MNSHQASRHKPDTESSSSYTMAHREHFRPAFTDRAVPNISYGLAFTRAVTHHVETTFHASRVYIIASKSLAANTDALSKLQDALGNRCIGTRIGMAPHTLFSDIISVVNAARPLNPDCIVTLGAGSLTDGSKVIAWALANDIHHDEGLKTLWSASPTKRDDLNPPLIPVIAIPTSLSGGEYHSFAGATDDETHAKCLFEPPVKNPALVVLDPALTVTTPEWVWLSTGVRSVDHCVEVLCSLRSKEGNDGEAEEGLKELIPALLRCKRDPGDLDARLDCMLGANSAARAVKGVPLGGSHAIGHQLGPMGVGHGETSCICLPAVCKYNAKEGANNERQRKCVEILMGIPEVKALVKGEDIDLGDILDLVIRELGQPRTLKDVGIGRDQVDQLAEHTLKDHWAYSNPVPLVKKEQVLEILEMVVG